MEKEYNNTLKIIKRLNIKTEEEYIKLLKYFLILNLESLKYISGTEDFNEIVKRAKEM